MSGDTAAAAAAARELLQLHAALAPHVPDLHRVDQLLRSSLALNEQSDVAPHLQQRVVQCEAAIALLSRPLEPTPGRELEDLRIMHSVREFVEEGVATLREHRVRGRQQGCEGGGGTHSAVAACWAHGVPVSCAPLADAAPPAPPPPLRRACWRR